jgi:hypothetical protein
LKFEWVSSKKNDIIADQLAFLFSQIPPEAECDIFQEFRDSLSDKAAFLLIQAFPGIEVYISSHVIVLGTSRTK